MRVTPAITGILGALAGLGVHAVLLTRFFSQSYGLFQTFLELLLALILGLAALLVATLCRRSARTLAVLMPVLGVLGFFPRPLSWIPAGVLLVAAGVAASVTALHRSDATRLGAPAAPMWGRGRRAAVIAGAVAAAAIVIPLSLGTISLGEAPDSTATAGVPSVAPRASTTTTTEPAPTTTVPAEDEEYTWYSDDRYGFAMKYPASWRNTDPSEVGERLHRRVIEAYSETFVAAAFADWSSPTFNGCYLDYVWVEVYDEAFMEVPTLPELREHIHERLDGLKARYADVKSIEPLGDVVIAGLPGLEQVWSMPYGGRVLTLRECVLVDKGRAYFMQLAAVEEDWQECQPIFDEMLRDFTVRSPDPLS